MSEHRLRPIGRSDLEIAPIGVGTWQWGDRSYWGYGESYGEADLEGVFHAALKAGLNFFDTAEIYAGGESERLLARRLASTDCKVVVASKYMPSPNRFTGRALERAVDASLAEIGRRPDRLVSDPLAVQSDIAPPAHEGAGGCGPLR